MPARPVPPQDRHVQRARAFRNVWIAVALVATAAVGACGAGPGPSRPAAARPSTATPSTAVTTWTSLDVGEPAYEEAIAGRFAAVQSGVAYGDGFVLVGSVDRDDRGPGSGAVWSTPDGARWSRVADPEGLFEDAYPIRVATDGRRLVALGWGAPGVHDRPGPDVAWISDDAVAWERHEVGRTALGQIDVAGVVGSISGFRAWGRTVDERTAVLQSPDGLEWSAIDLPGDADSTIAGIAPYGGGYVAVGATRDADNIIGAPSQPARAWFSPDGTQWEAAPVPDGWELRGVYPAARGIHAIGARACSRCVGPDLAWHSVDGRSWTLVGEGPKHQGLAASNGSQIASYAWQDDRSISMSSDGLTWQKLVANLPKPDWDGGLIVGSTGILLLIAQTPVVDGVGHLQSGVLFLKGT